MRNELFDEIGDALFTAAIAAAIGIGAANIPIQVNKERAALEAAAASQRLGPVAYPPSSRDVGDIDSDKTPPAF